MNLPSLNTSVRQVLRSVQVNMPWRFLPQYRDMLLELGINVELGFEAHVLDHVPRREFRAFSDELRKTGCRVTLHGPFWDLSPGSFDPLVRHATRLRLQQFFDLLTVFRPVQVVCHTGYDSRHYRDRRTRYLENSIATWEPLVEQAERFETPLLIENVWEHDPEFHQELLSALPSPCFGFCLDVGHQHSFSTTSLDTWLRTLGDRLMEIHLHDNDGSHDYHLPIGFGTIDFDRLFAFLLENQKKPVLTLEPHTKEHLFQSLEGLDKVLPPSLRSS